MEKILLAAAIATFTGFVSSAYAAPAPCEDMLKELRTATSAATLNAADAKAVAGLEAKGVERCNADDDKRADVFFADAMKLLGK